MWVKLVLNFGRWCLQLVTTISVEYSGYSPPAMYVLRSTHSFTRFLLPKLASILVPSGICGYLLRFLLSVEAVGQSAPRLVHFFIFSGGPFPVYLLDSQKSWTRLKTPILAKKRKEKKKRRCYQVCPGCGTPHPGLCTPAHKARICQPRR